MHSRLITLGLIGMLASGSVRAEGEDRSIPLPGAGVGVSVGNAFSGGPTTSSPIAVHVPINLAEHFRLQPCFGYWYVGKGIPTTVVDGNTSTGGYAADVGVGAFYVFRPVPPFSVHVGGRVGMNFSGRSQESPLGVTTSLSEADLYVNPTTGLEWAVARSFPVGDEAQLALRWYLDPAVTFMRFYL